MKYAFVLKNADEIPVSSQCQLLGISTSGYYDWCNRSTEADKRRERQTIIDAAVELAFHQRKQRYGSPRLSIDLCESGFHINEKTVAFSMQRQSLVAKAGRKFKATTNSNHCLPIAPNLLKQDFTCNSINEKWCGDITYLWTKEGWLYLAVVIDLFSRRVIGWSMSHRMTRQLACDAMQMAIDARLPSTDVIMHTDRGSQYCSKQFQNLLRKYKLKSSMSKKGDCFDNACAESFFHSMKVEAIHGEDLPTRESMRSAVFEYIEIDYNRTRHHTTIGNQSPANYELAQAA